MEKVPEYFERIWSQALLAVSTAEEEAHKVVSRLADAAGWSQDEVRQRARELTERLVSQRRELERNLEEGVRRALTRIRLPRREDVMHASARLEKLAERVSALEGSR